MLYRNGKVGGDQIDYPVTLSINGGTVVVNELDELIDLIFAEFVGLTKNNDKGDPFKILYGNVLWRFGIQCDAGEPGTSSLFDDRTTQMITTYQYYQSAPHLAFNCKAWFDAVLIMKSIFAERLF